MKDKFLEYKLLLQTIGNLQSGDEVLGDKETLERLKKSLVQDKILEPNYQISKPVFRLYASGSRGYEKLEHTKDMSKIINRIDFELTRFEYDKFTIIEKINGGDVPILTFYSDEVREYKEYRKTKGGK